ncbi:hypothetical protein Hanom_Chr08g00729131 [Helianthus anomalus]
MKENHILFTIQTRRHNQTPIHLSLDAHPAHTPRLTTDGVSLRQRHPSTSTPSLCFSSGDRKYRRIRQRYGGRRHEGSSTGLLGLSNEYDKEVRERRD